MRRCLEWHLKPDCWVEYLPARLAWVPGQGFSKGSRLARWVPRVRSEQRRAERSLMPQIHWGRAGGTRAEHFAPRRFPEKGKARGGKRKRIGGNPAKPGGTMWVGMGSWLCISAAPSGGLIVSRRRNKPRAPLKSAASGRLDIRRVSQADHKIACFSPAEKLPSLFSAEAGWLNMVRTTEISKIIQGRCARSGSCRQTLHSSATS